MSSTIGGCCKLKKKKSRCWWAASQEMQQEVHAEVQPGEKMVAGDSAKSQIEGYCCERPFRTGPKHVSGLKISESLRRGRRLPLRLSRVLIDSPFICTLPPFLHTVLNFHSFSSFLPFDGPLCVQAVGKFPVMVRSSTTGTPLPSPSPSPNAMTQRTPPPTLSFFLQARQVPQSLCHTSSSSAPSSETRT